MGRAASADSFFVSLLSLTLRERNFSLLSFPPGSKPPNRDWTLLAVVAKEGIYSLVDSVSGTLTDYPY